MGRFIARLLALPAIMALAIATLLLASPLTPAHADDTVVAVGAGNAPAFSPNVVTLQPGDQVTFNWESGFHNVVAVNGEFSSGAPTGAVGTTYVFTASQEGTIYFFCEVHATAADATDENIASGNPMVGKIVVATAAVSPTPTPAATVEPSPAAGQCVFAVVDQAVAPGSKTIVVSNARQARSGYVVVHESGPTGGPGAVIGALPITGGTNYNALEVGLDRSLVNGETLWPMLHTEDSGNATYDGETVDLPTIDTACGNPEVGNVATFPIKVTITSTPNAPGTGTGLVSSDNSGMATIAAALGVATLAVVATAGGLAFARARKQS